jgi:hypothetical protein
MNPLPGDTEGREVLLRLLQEEYAHVQQQNQRLTRLSSSLDQIAAEDNSIVSDIARELVKCRASSNAFEAHQHYTACQNLLEARADLLERSDELMARVDSIVDDLTAGSVQRLSRSAQHGETQRHG